MGVPRGGARRLAGAHRPPVAAVGEGAGAPVGGSGAPPPLAWLSAQALDPAAILAAVGRPGHGGSALFVGTVRDEPHVREVVSLDYEAFEQMAVPEMQAICAEAADRFGALCVMAHRTGPVAVGEPSVVVATSAPGRRVALEACAWAIDQLKARVPVWKLQRFADGGTEWSEGA